mmetsp:Transcript_24375/g.39051  ORF Transcript_24375/g.39051 Transcript_24375/m.39051 type:complete len:351 (-) Transcript_24375:114-1166(-)
MVAPMLSGAFVAVLAAVIVSSTFGISLLRSNEGKLKGGVAVIDFFMGFGFLVRFVRHRRAGNRDRNSTSSMDLGSALLYREEAVELVESDSVGSANGDSLEDDEDDRVGRTLGNETFIADVVIEGSGADIETADRYEADRFGASRSRRTSVLSDLETERQSVNNGILDQRHRSYIQDEENNSFNGLLSEELDEEASYMQHCFRKVKRIMGESFVDPRACFTMLYIAFLGSLSGMIGFGGGNAFAIYYIMVFEWSTLAATCASSFISGCMTFSLILSFLANKAVDVSEISHLVAISLPCDIIALLLASHYARRMSEQAICLVVAILFFSIGVFVVIFTSMSSSSTSVQQEM